ncbi:hypothetical protein [Rhizobium sp. JAB6]|uniref:hypothetical protein n=1 Tax=Rhizobium sp. JAB6 TaxID=2127050 RepID=UPI0013AF7EA3|nr:hypothetical protein [Rhizobium sp. JAB6]
MIAWVAGHFSVLRNAYPTLRKAIGSKPIYPFPLADLRIASFAAVLECSFLDGDLRERLERSAPVALERPGGNIVLAPLLETVC